MLDPQVAYDKLAQFETYEDIVSFLQHQDIQGYKLDSNTCPIAIYMRRTTGLRSFYVADVVQYRDRMERFIQFPLTEAMHRFIAEFDSGCIISLDADYETMEEFDAPD